MRNFCSVHTHSTMCDGKNTLAEMAAAAFAAGAASFGASGHSHTPIPAATQPPRTETPEFVNLVRVDLDEYRRKHDSRAVKKTLSIPSWLNAQAEQAGINFSAVLQEALKARLGIGHGSGTR